MALTQIMAALAVGIVTEAVPIWIALLRAYNSDRKETSRGNALFFGWLFLGGPIASVILWFFVSRFFGWPFP